MKGENCDLFDSEGTDEIYTSSNKIIRWLGDRLINAVHSMITTWKKDVMFGLNVGCGEGQMIFRLIQKGMKHEVTAVDIDPERIAYAHRLIPASNCIRADIFSLPFQSAAFEYVIATEILEHLHNPKTALRELIRVAKPGAAVILSVPHEPFFQWGNLFRGKHWKSWGRTPSHVQFWSRSEFRSIISEFITVQEERWISCFPWQLYLGLLKLN